MKTILSITTIAALAASGSLCAQTAYSNPSGYVSQTCPSNSDTIVGLPLRLSSAYSGTLSAAPSVTQPNESAVLTLSGTPGLTANAFNNTHYVKFTVSTNGLGQWFPIVSNTADSITVDLNGAAIDATTGNALEVIKFWTLNELFPPASATTDPATTGTAIVASTSQLGAGRRTEVLLPDLVSVGTNLAPTNAYYIHAGIWKKAGSGATDFGATQLWPDNYFIIRNPQAVASSTSYTISAQVDSSAFDVSLRTSATGSQDNYISIPRPVDITLTQLGLANTSAFVASTSQLGAGRRDEVLVYDNSATGTNKAPASTYYYHGGIWKKAGSGATDFSNEIIKAGSGIVIRKYVGTGTNVVWENTPNY